MGSLRDLASWEVEYRDGGGLSQWQPDGTETPYRAIEWSRVSRLILESQAGRQTFDITPTPDIHLSLRSRHFMTAEGTASMCFMLVGSDADVDIVLLGSSPEYDKKVQWVMYWFPDLTMHTCPKFECGDVRQYGSSLVHGLPRKLMPETHITEVLVSTMVTDSGQ